MSKLEKEKWRDRNGTRVMIKKRNATKRKEKKENILQLGFNMKDES